MEWFRLPIPYFGIVATFFKDVSIIECLEWDSKFLGRVECPVHVHDTSSRQLGTKNLPCEI